MGKPYSMDLRERVVAAVEKGGLSCHKAAAKFGVSISSAIKWTRRMRETGSVAPDQMGGHKPKAIASEHRIWLLERIKSDFTLRGLVAELAERGHADRVKPAPVPRIIAGGFGVDDFTVDHAAGTATCPNGLTRPDQPHRICHLRRWLCDLPAARPMHPQPHRQETQSRRP